MKHSYKIHPIESDEIKEIGYKIMNSTGKFSGNFANKEYYLYFEKK